MIEGRRWRVVRLCVWLCRGFVVGSCGNGCARPVPISPARVDAPTAMAESPADVYVDEPRLSDEEP